ncbi:hypothetical protein [Litorivivens sp.]|uniref:hypothetical protein n=1 Tax=Litorivivens sp. TaxID=2020868 RepID=UPI00356B3B3A
MAELKIHIDKNRIGFVQAYLENTGKEAVTVVTDSLIYKASGERVDITPEVQLWQRRDGDVLLKSSLVHYGAVTLQPGEITYLQSPNIRVVSKEIVYTIPEAWGRLHGTWVGSATVRLQPSN